MSVLFLLIVVWLDTFMHFRSFISVISAGTKSGSYTEEPADEWLFARTRCYRY